MSRRSLYDQSTVGSESSAFTRFTPATDLLSEPDFLRADDQNNVLADDFLADVRLNNTPGSAVPWPNNTYMILEKSSRRAMTVVNGKLVLEDVQPEGSENPGERRGNRWTCVDHKGYCVFYETKSGKYLGHDGKSGMVANAARPDGWECLIPRAHVNGGHKLMTIFWSELWTIVVGEDGKSVVRRQHGDTAWEFFKV